MKPPKIEMTNTAIRMGETVTDANMIVQLTVGELRALVRDEVRSALSERGGPPVPQIGKWVDVATAAKVFGCTPQSIRNWIRAGAPARQIGTSTHPQFRIRLEEFETWMPALHENRGVATK
jgi:hypothetical protein